MPQNTHFHYQQLFTKSTNGTCLDFFKAELVTYVENSQCDVKLPRICSLSNLIWKLWNEFAFSTSMIYYLQPLHFIFPSYQNIVLSSSCLLVTS